MPSPPLTDGNERQRILALATDFPAIWRDPNTPQRERGLRTGAGDTFDSNCIHWVRFAPKLKSLKQRLLEDGWQTAKQIASTLGVKRTTLGRGRRQGRIQA